jgi:hypothetical protein
LDEVQVVIQGAVDVVWRIVTCSHGNYSNIGTLGDLWTAAAEFMLFHILYFASYFFCILTQLEELIFLQLETSSILHFLLSVSPLHAMSQFDHLNVLALKLQEPKRSEQW